MIRLLHIWTLLLGLMIAPFGATFLGGAVLTGLSPIAATAQQPPAGPDYEAWGKTATRAEEAIESGRASNSAMEDLRNQLVAWREVFFVAQRLNANAISTVSAQMTALGPAPDDAAEAPGISQQREELATQLASLRAPVKRAEAAYSQADGMIKSVDRIIRERQTEELMELGPSPVNPIHWPEGLSALYSMVEAVRAEISTSLQSEVQAKDTRNNLPVMIILMLIGTILMIRGRFWVELLARFILPHKATSIRWMITWLVSLGEIAVPYLGFMAFTKGLYASGLVGFRGDILVQALAPSVLIFLVSRWLALRCFPRSDLHRLPLLLEASDRRSGRYFGASLGVIIAVFHFFNQISEINDWSVSAKNVVLFPVIVVAALLLIRLSRILAKHSRAAASNEAFDSYRNRLTRLLSRALFALAIVAPTLAAIGYFKAATALLLPSLLSLLLLAALLVIQRVITETYTLLTGNRDGASDDLIPILAGFTTVVLSGPIFALIWGARVADLSELWAQFIRGVSVGGLRISPSVFITLAVVFTVGFILTRLLQGTLKNTVLPKTKLDAGGRNAIVSGLGYVGILLSALIAVSSAGIDLSSLAIVAGALSLGIGFGLQNIVSNFVSGIILLIERPISQGDWIEVGGQHGTVRDISVRSTRIETFDRSDVIVPNSEFISGTVTNYTRGNTVGRVIVPVGVAYGSDTRVVEKILLAIAEDHPMVLLNPPPSVVFTNLGASTYDFEIRAILRDVNWVLSVKSDFNHEIVKRLAAANIEIAFPQQDIWIRNPEALLPGQQPAKDEAEAGDSGPPEEQGGTSAPKPTKDAPPADDVEGDPDGDSR